MLHFAEDAGCLETVRIGEGIQNVETFQHMVPETFFPFPPQNEEIERNKETQPPNPITNSSNMFCAEKQESRDASDLALNSLGYSTLALLDSLFKNNLTLTDVHAPVDYTAHLHTDLCADFLAH